MNKIISLILALTAALSSFCTMGAGDVLYSLGLNLGLPMSDRADFLQDIDDGDVSQFDDDTGYIKNMLLVFFDENANLFDRIRILGASGGAAVGNLRAARLCVIRTNGCNYEQLAAKAEKLNALPGVALASVCPAKRMEEQYTPDDPFSPDSVTYRVDWTEHRPSGNNWNLEAVDARRAWGYDAYYNDINIGIVDGGFQTDHPDLNGKIRFPSAFLARRNRPNSHGDHVAGIIAAQGDNGIGICGLCQNCSLTCVDWSASDGQAWINDVEIFFGFGYVVKAGAKVINFSIGASGSLGEEAKAFPNLYLKLDAALYSCYMSALLFSGYDFICVQSSGNGNDGGHAVDAIQNTLFCSITEKNAFTPFPGVTAQDLLDRILIVGSARLENNRYIQSSSSNVGTQVSICAPGVNIYSCVTDSDWGYKSGTSMASPHVAAIAAMVWSVNPNLRAAQVKDIVCSSTKDTVEIASTRYFEDLDYRTYPMVNAGLAVEAAVETIGGIRTAVNLGADRYSTVTLTDTKGRTFEFETNEQGDLSVVLLPGTYSVAYQSNRQPAATSITISAQEG